MRGERRLTFIIGAGFVGLGLLGLAVSSLASMEHKPAVIIDNRPQPQPRPKQRVPKPPPQPIGPLQTTLKIANGGLLTRDDGLQLKVESVTIRQDDTKIDFVAQASIDRESALCPDLGRESFLNDNSGGRRKILREVGSWPQKDGYEECRWLAPGEIFKFSEIFERLPNDVSVFRIYRLGWPGDGIISISVNGG